MSNKLNEKRKPDYRVAALDKTTDLKGNVGAAWVNDDKTVTIVLDPFITLHGGKNLLITLFENDR